MEIRKLIKTNYFDKFPNVVKVENGLLWRIDVRDCLEYRSDCIYISDEYIFRMREAIINDSKLWFNTKAENGEELLNIDHLGYFLAINKDYIAYDCQTLYDLCSHIRTEEYKDWIIKALVE